MPNNSNTKQSKSWREQIAIHPAADMFRAMTPDELKPLGEDIKKNGQAVPVVMWEAEKGAPLMLLDGRSRFDAMEAVGLAVHDQEGIWLSPRIRCDVVRGGDPYELVLCFNEHRRHDTPEERRGVIARLLQAHPDKSDRQIAEMAKDEHKKVGRVRANLEARGAMPHVEKRTDTKGRKQPTKKPPAKKTRRDVDDYIAENKAKMAAAKNAEAPQQIPAYAETAAIADNGNGRMTVTISDGWHEPLAKSAKYLGVPADEYAEFLMQLGQRTFNSKFQSMRPPAAHGLSNDIAWWLIEMHSKYPDTFNVGSWEGSCGYLAIDKLYAQRGVPIGKFREWQQAERNTRREAKRDTASAPAAPPVGDELDIPACLKRN